MRANVPEIAGLRQKRYEKRQGKDAKRFVQRREFTVLGCSDAAKHAMDDGHASKARSLEQRHLKTPLMPGSGHGHPLNRRHVGCFVSNRRFDSRLFACTRSYILWLNNTGSAGFPRPLHIYLRNQGVYAILNSAHMVFADANPSTHYSGTSSPKDFQKSHRKP